MNSLKKDQTSLKRSISIVGSSEKQSISGNDNSSPNSKQGAPRFLQTMKTMKNKNFNALTI